MRKQISEEQAIEHFSKITHRIADGVFSLGGVGVLEIDSVVSNTLNSYTSSVEYYLYEEGDYERESVK